MKSYPVSFRLFSRSLISALLPLSQSTTNSSQSLKRKMPKCNLFDHGKPGLRRSPRFLSLENFRKMDHSETPFSSKSKVRTLSQSPFTPTDSTGTGSPLKSKRPVKSVKLTNGSAKPAGFKGVLRRSQRIANLQSTPANAYEKSLVEDSLLSDSSMKFDSLEVTQKGEGQTERRVSLRLMGLAKGVKDLGAVLGELSSSEVALKGGHRKEHSSVTSVDDSSGVLRKCCFLDVAQKEESRKQWRRSVRLMGSDRSSKSLIGHFEKTVGSKVIQKRSKVIQKRYRPKGRRNSCMLTGSGKGLSELSDSSDKKVPVASSECQKRQRSVRLMASADGVEKLEMGVHVHEELGRKMEWEVEKVNSTALMLKEAGNKRRKIESGGVGIIEKTSDPPVEGCNFPGWTEDQEAALHRAFLVAKPSPHFWKNVSKMVPGKSAQECYDKVHSNHETPPPQRRLSRNKMNGSPLGHFKLSAGKLLEISGFNGKKLRNSKHKNLLAQKTVRHLLQKHLLVDQGYEADLFSVLETTKDLSGQGLPQMNMPMTPDCILKPYSHERSSLNVKRTISKFEESCRADFTSPPVLKQVKNMALHEKYIDQLHSREERRKKISSACPMNRGNSDNVTKDIGAKNMNIKAARATLVSDAKDAINKFQNMQSIGIDYKDTGYGDDDSEVGLF